MAKKQKEPQDMMEFVLNKMTTEDLATAALIRPLPGTVRPSAEFLAATRAQILSAAAAESREKRAA